MAVNALKLRGVRGSTILSNFILGILVLSPAAITLSQLQNSVVTDALDHDMLIMSHYVIQCIIIYMSVHQMVGILRLSLV